MLDLIQELIKGLSGIFFVCALVSLTLAIKFACHIHFFIRPPQEGETKKEIVPFNRDTYFQKSALALGISIAFGLIALVALRFIEVYNLVNKDPVIHLVVQMPHPLADPQSQEGLPRIVLPPGANRPVTK